MATSERNGILLVALGRWWDRVVQGAAAKGIVLWKSNYPLLLSQTVINHIFWKVELTFSSHTQAWLMQELMNYQIT